MKLKRECWAILLQNVKIIAMAPVASWEKNHEKINGGKKNEINFNNSNECMKCCFNEKGEHTRYDLSRLTTLRTHSTMMH